MLAKLRGHEYAAIVLDQPAIQAFAARAPACDLFPVGKTRSEPHHACLRSGVKLHWVDPRCCTLDASSGVVRCIHRKHALANDVSLAVAGLGSVCCGTKSSMLRCH